MEPKTSTKDEPTAAACELCGGEGWIDVACSWCYLASPAHKCRRCEDSGVLRKACVGCQEPNDEPTDDQDRRIDEAMSHG